jgi:hypothetical protein
MKLTKSIICLIAVSFTLHSAIPLAVENTEQPSEDIEQITVTGNDQINVLRYQMHRAEEEFFDFFNQLTTNKDFQITCKQEAKHGFTRIKQRNCSSAFETRIEFELTQDALRTRGGLENVPLRGEIYTAQKIVRKKQLEEMKKLISENPDFQQKLIALNNAKAKFEQAKTAK